MSNVRRRMKLPLPSKTFLSIVVAVLLVCLPFPTTTVPERRVRFLDAKAMPLANLPVEQVWQAGSIEPSPNHESTHTDSNGYAVFPRRTIWAPAILRAAYFATVELARLRYVNRAASSSIKASCDVLEVQERPVPLLSTSPEQVVLRYFDMSRVRSALREERSTSPECAAVEAQLRNADA
jgi:hypothetical protein